MFFTLWSPLLLVAAGSMIMAFNIRKAFSVAKQMGAMRGGRRTCPGIVMAFYIALLIFFFIGYAVIGVMLFLPAFVVSHLLIGLIFFFGSVFVLLGLYVQSSMGKAVSRANLEVTQALITAVEARDKNLNGHSLHVARLSLLLYDRLPRARQKKLDRTSLEYAALLHDVGKLGIPEAILNKEGPLTDAEWEVVKKHPQIGRDILCSLKQFGNLADWVLYHHERCDGKGYYGLPMEEIPLASRIIAVADTFSTLTMTRPYRHSQTYDEAVRVLMDCAGPQLDRELVERFLTIPREFVGAPQEDTRSFFQNGPI